MRRIILDCDPGIDDAVGIILAVKSQVLKVEAITAVTGNLTADRTCVNALKVLEMLGIDSIPVAQGMLTPLVRKYPKDPFFHGDDGLGNTGLPAPTLKRDPRFAPDLIVETVNRFPGDISIVATGPLTNIAQALMKDPELARKVNELIIIGGAFGFNKYAYINATGDNPVSEWNIYVDPEAAHIVFHSGIRLTAVGLDVVTHPDINLQPHDIEKLEKGKTREAKFLVDLNRFAKERNFLSYCTLIDSMAVATAIDPTILKMQRIHCDIETKGELTLGQTVTDIRDHFRWTHLPEIDAACDADFPKFRDLLISTLVRE